MPRSLTAAACGLEAAALTGQGVRLCETCYQRESRRAVESGEAVAEGQGGVLPEIAGE